MIKYKLFLRFDVLFLISINNLQKENEKERDEITTEEAHFAVEDDNNNVVVKVDGESRDSHMY